MRATTAQEVGAVERSHRVTRVNAMSFRGRDKTSLEVVVDGSGKISGGFEMGRWGEG